MKYWSFVKTEMFSLNVFPAHNSSLNSFEGNWNTDMNTFMQFFLMSFWLYLYIYESLSCSRNKCWVVNDGLVRKSSILRFIYDSPAPHFAQISLSWLSFLKQTHKSGLWKSVCFFAQTGILNSLTHFGRQVWWFT